MRIRAKWKGKRSKSSQEVAVEVVVVEAVAHAKENFPALIVLKVVLAVKIATKGGREDAVVAVEVWVTQVKVLKDEERGGDAVVIHPLLINHHDGHDLVTRVIEAAKVSEILTEKIAIESNETMNISVNDRNSSKIQHINASKQKHSMRSKEDQSWMEDTAMMVIFNTTGNIQLTITIGTSMKVPTKRGEQLDHRRPAQLTLRNLCQRKAKCLAGMTKMRV